MSKACKKDRHHFHIELTPAQYQMLADQTKQCGLTKRAYLVRFIEENPVRTHPSREIKELRMEIRHIGNNCQHRFEIVRKRRRNFAGFQQEGNKNQVLP